MINSILGPNHIKNKSYKGSIKYLLIAIITLTVTIALQLGVGYYINSHILIASGWHTVVDATAIIGAFIVLKLSSKPNTSNKTYGYTRLETLLGFFNGVLLLFVAIPLLFKIVLATLQYFNINIGLLDLFEDMHDHDHDHEEHAEHNHAKHDHDHDHDHDHSEHAVATSSLVHSHLDINSSKLVLLISGIGFLAHVILAIMLYVGNKASKANNILIQSTFLHMLNDVFTTLIAVVGSVLLIYTKQPIVDKWIALILVLLIINLAIKLLFRTGNILLESAPKHINIHHIKSTIEKQVENVISIHHIHVWELNEEEILATAVITLHNNNNYLQSVAQIKQILQQHYNIKHITIELANTTQHNCNT